MRKTSSGINFTLDTGPGEPVNDGGVTWNASPQDQASPVPVFTDCFSPPERVIPVRVSDLLYE